jgi:surface polysaccharide O-acyltransferase-like enzyme
MERNVVKHRQSNLELLRILSMAFVLILHTNYNGIGAPTSADIQSDILISFYRNIVESLALVGVNCFVLISGWFGINFKFEGLIKLIFQCIFIYALIFVVFIGFGIKEISSKNIIDCFDFLNRWFLFAYIGLYLLAPVLNVFIKNTTQSNYRLFLICFGTFIIIICWLHKQYLPIPSFVFIYLLARYIRIYGGRIFDLSKGKDLFIYIVLTFISALLLLLSESLSHGPSIFMAYNCPIIFISSLYLFLFFTKLNIKNHAINWIASSAFAVYLINCNKFIRPYWTELSIKLFSNFNFIYFSVLILGAVLLFFISCVFIDKVRDIIWRRILKISN